MLVGDSYTRPVPDLVSRIRILGACIESHLLPGILRQGGKIPKRHTLSGPRHLVNDAEEYLQEMGGRFVPVPWVSESIRYDGSGSSFILRSGSIAANTPFTLQGIHAMIHKFKLYPP